MNIIQGIKLLFSVRAPVQQIAGELKDIKSGWKTIPFWVTLTGSLVSLGAAIQGFIPGTIAVVIITSLTVIYNILRGLIKADVNGVRPVFQSSEFWAGVIGILSDGILTLKNGGVSAPWMTTASTILATVMASAQNLGNR
ncbi:MAG TPA: hypothetical protein VF974_08320 [Patescibacteria group bacterium]